MGGVVSRGIDNQSLMDELISSGITLTPELERAMRLVDRGDYTQERNQRVYMDLAWRSKTLHLSAPSIYAVALRNLEIEPGLHFLNIGSGTGYLSTIIGLLLGENGVNHGLEVEKLNVLYARERLTAFLKECDAPFERPFCTPYFMQGNILDLVAPPVQAGSTSMFVNSSAGNAPTQEETSVSILISLINPSTSPSRGSNLGAFFPPTPQSRAGNSPVAEDADRSPANETVEEEPVSAATDRNQSVEMCEESGASGLDENDDDEDDDDIDEEDYEDNARTYNSILRDGHCAIAPPPVLSNNFEIEHNDTDDSLSRWPLYDRIYVGASVVDRSHLEAILRLLKVGGIMVAPVRDKFLKIKRTSEDSISITELMSVSFATLVVPPADSSHSVEMPPPREVSSLEQICARFIRARLKKAIELRHNGLPTLGRLEEIKTTVEEKVAVNPDVKKNRSNNKSNNKTERADGPSAKPCTNSVSPGLNSSSSSSCVDSVASLVTAENGNMASDRTTASDSTNSIRQHIHAYLSGFMAQSTGEKDWNNEEDELANSDPGRSPNEDSESRGTSPKRQKSQYHWVSQSYTFKEEMKKILLEELHFTAFLARSVITL